MVEKGWYELIQYYCSQKTVAEVPHFSRGACAYVGRSKTGRLCAIMYCSCALFALAVYLVFVCLLSAISPNG